jgi:hypothetical protein
MDREDELNTALVQRLPVGPNIAAYGLLMDVVADFRDAETFAMDMLRKAMLSHTIARDHRILFRIHA